jgi:hypothetical protein
MCRGCLVYCVHGRRLFTYSPLMRSGMLTVERAIAIVVKQEGVFMLNLNGCHKIRGTKALCQIVLPIGTLTRKTDNKRTCLGLFTMSLINP